jgi:hypothetical protein
MGRIYRVQFNGVSVTAQQDLFEITAATGKHCRIHAWMVSQSTEVGDAQEEGLSVLLRRGTSGTTSGTGGSAATPVVQNASDTAAGASAEVNNTTRMSGGTITTEEPHSWNVRVPYMMIYTPEFRPQIAPGERKTLELATTPADAITMSGWMVIEEEG